MLAKRRLISPLHACYRQYNGARSGLASARRCIAVCFTGCGGLAGSGSKTLHIRSLTLRGGPAAERRKRRKRRL
jgi:hypothetical protein